MSITTVRNIKCTLCMNYRVHGKFAFTKDKRKDDKNRVCEK